MSIFESMHIYNQQLVVRKYIYLKGVIYNGNKNKVLEINLIDVQNR